jgi:hypothetical protein
MKPRPGERSRTWRLASEYSPSGRAVRASCTRPATARERCDSHSPFGISAMRPRFCCYVPVAIDIDLLESRPSKDARKLRRGVCRCESSVMPRREVNRKRPPTARRAGDRLGDATKSGHRRLGRRWSRVRTRGTRRAVPSNTGGAALGGGAG